LALCLSHNVCGTAEVPVLRLRQAFWLAAVVGLWGGGLHGPWMAFFSFQNL